MNLGKFKTCRRFDEPGDAHALTFTCFKGQPFLAKDRSRQWMIDSIERARQKHQFDLWAYVIMLEHVHLVIRPKEDHYSQSFNFRVPPEISPPNLPQPTQPPKANAGLFKKSPAFTV